MSDQKDDDVDSTEYWGGIKQAADNRIMSAAHLKKHGILFTENDFGAHLIVEGQACLIDFWPGTGRWNCPNGKKGFGVRNLVKYIQETKIAEAMKP